VPDFGFLTSFLPRKMFRPIKGAGSDPNIMRTWDTCRSFLSFDRPSARYKYSPDYYRIPYGELRNKLERWGAGKIFWDKERKDREIRERKESAKGEKKGRDVRPEHERDRY